MLSLRGSLKYTWPFFDSSQSNGHAKCEKSDKRLNLSLDCRGRVPPLPTGVLVTHLHSHTLFVHNSYFTCFCFHNTINIHKASPLLNDPLYLFRDFQVDRVSVIANVLEYARGRAEMLVTQVLRSQLPLSVPAFESQTTRVTVICRQPTLCACHSFHQQNQAHF